MAQAGQFPARNLHVDWEFPIATFEKITWITIKFGFIQTCWIIDISKLGDHINRDA